MSPWNHLYRFGSTSLLIVPLFYSILFSPFLTDVVTVQTGLVTAVCAVIDLILFLLVVSALFQMSASLPFPRTCPFLMPLSLVF